MASFFDCFAQLDISVREYRPTQLYQPVFLELSVSLLLTSYQKNLKKKIISQSIRQNWQAIYFDFVKVHLMYESAFQSSIFLRESYLFAY